MLVRENIKVSDSVAGVQVVVKNYTLFTNWITGVNNKRIDKVRNICITMPLYSFIQKQLDVYGRRNHLTLM